ncbi:MAG: hypothetical protein HFI10_14980 [Lachnospiraceae bacterium]|jgi:hypothetical protein|nr:hypothetical protein [Lachnospiraceae bacterium]
MRKNYFEEMQTCIMERLGKIYNEDDEYLRKLDRENELERQMENVLPRKYRKVVEEYHDAVCDSWGVCEMLAYQQGMRDLADMLRIKSREEDGGILSGKEDTWSYICPPCCPQKSNCCLQK